MKKYTEIKSFLVESLLESFPQAEGDEIEAMVTHFLQSQNIEIPFLTPVMREHCVALLQSLRPRSTHLKGIRGSITPYHSISPRKISPIHIH